MAPIVRIGITFVPSLPPESLRAIAVAADSSGLDDLWIWEDCFKESGIATASAALAWTGRIRVGIALMPTPLRNVALAAMEIATLGRLFPGRFVAGVGHGVQDWMAQVGGKVDSPLTLLTEYVDVLRRLLAGELVDRQGRYLHLDGVKLDWPPSLPPPLMLGGAGPKTLELAARIGDGTLLMSALTDDEVRAIGELVAATRAGLADQPGRPDRSGSAHGSGAHEVLATQIAATGPGASERVDDEVVASGRTAGLGIGVAGDAATIAASLRRLAGFGMTAVSIQPTRDEPDLDGFIHFLGQEVRPLLID